MNYRGGYNILLHNRPEDTIEVVPDPEKLVVPLKSLRFDFTDICVKDGQKVSAGEVLARDPNNFSIPLLTPRAATIKLDLIPGHIVLEDIAALPIADTPNEQHAKTDQESMLLKTSRLLEKGAWQFFYDAQNGNLPDPTTSPAAVIVSTIHLEPYTAKSSAQLKEGIDSFTRGLEYLQSLLEYQPIYLAIVKPLTDLAQRLKTTLRGYARIQFLEVPHTYPNDNLAVIARNLPSLSQSDQPIWAVRTEGIMAIDKVMNDDQPVVDRIISLAGPMVSNPRHLKVPVGYPLEQLLKSNLNDNSSVRIINGGVFTGRDFGDEQKGLGTECGGLTILDDKPQREFLAFVRPGSDRRSYSKCFLSSLRGLFKESLNTATRGERRPCVSCNACEKVCPAGILPYAVHRAVYRDDIDEIAALGVDRCVRCGLCSFICLSKINLMDEFIEAQGQIARERAEIAAQTQEEVTA